MEQKIANKRMEVNNMNESTKQYALIALGVLLGTTGLYLGGVKIAEIKLLLTSLIIVLGACLCLAGLLNVLLSGGEKL